MENKNYKDFSTKIDSIIDSLKSKKASVGSVGSSSLVSDIEEDLKELGAFVAEFSAFDKIKADNRKTIKEYIGTEPSNPHHPTFHHNATRASSSPLPMAQELLENEVAEKKEIVKKILVAKNICQFIQTKFQTSASKVAQLEKETANTPEPHWSKSYTAGVELQHKDELTKGNNIEAIKANIFLGIRAKQFAYEDKEFQEFLLEDAAEYYVRALTLAKKLDQPKYISDISDLLREIGRDENGGVLMNTASSSSTSSFSPNPTKN